MKLLLSAGMPPKTNYMTTQRALTTIHHQRLLQCHDTPLGHFVNYCAFPFTNIFVHRTFFHCDVYLFISICTLCAPNSHCTLFSSLCTMYTKPLFCTFPILTRLYADVRRCNELGTSPASSPRCSIHTINDILLRCVFYDYL